MPTRILIIDETPVVGEAIAEALRPQRDFEVMTVANSLAAGRELIEQSHVVILSENLPEEDTQKVIDLAAGQEPATPLILIGYGSAPEAPRTIVEHPHFWDKRQAASGLIESIRVVSPKLDPDQPKTGPLRDNLARMEKVRDALHRAALLSRELSERLEVQMHAAQEHTRDSRLRRQLGVELTDRQRQVMELVAQELTNAEIAQRLHITEGTVKNHVHNILSRFGVDSREEAALIYRGRQQRKT